MNFYSTNSRICFKKPTTNVLNVFVLTYLRLMAQLLLAFNVILALTNYKVEASEGWHYPDPNKNEPFPAWGGLCDYGKSQSPINLALNTALKGVFDEPLMGIDYNEMINKVTFTNTGHSLQLSKFDKKFKLKGGPLGDDIFILEQIHFHWPSEHTISQIRYPLEMHMVHRNAKYLNGTQAAQMKDGLVVIGVLYHASLQRNHMLDDIIDHLDKVYSRDKVNVPKSFEVNYRISGLLPKLENYITYSGSLTTPQCFETVTWIIVAETYPISIDQINAFKNMEDSAGKKMMSNYRNLQPRNERNIIQVSNSDSYYLNSASMKHISIFSVIVLVFLCISINYEKY